jgi:hypothetical protein
VLNHCVCGKPTHDKTHMTAGCCCCWAATFFWEGGWTVQKRVQGRKVNCCCCELNAKRECFFWQLGGCLFITECVWRQFSHLPCHRRALRYGGLARFSSSSSTDCAVITRCKCIHRDKSGSTLLSFPPEVWRLCSSVMLSFVAWHDEWADVGPTLSRIL